MKRCVIHIGMHKTGSTSIQVSFGNTLNNSEWKYAQLGHSNHSYILKQILQKNLPDAQAIIGNNEFVERLIKDLNQDGENYLLSGEWMSSNIGLSRIIALRDLLLSKVKNVAIVGYVRSPKSYMESSFQERLKMNAVKLDFENLRPKYRNRLEFFDIAFGKENVMFWKFDPIAFKNKCVVQDFCSRLDIAFPENQIKRRNEGLSREAIAFLYTYRKYASEQGNNKKFSVKENVALVNHLTHLKGSKFRFATEVIKPVLAANQADIEWMEQRIGQSLQEPYEDSKEAIRSEEDLLRYDPKALMWLAEQLGLQSIENRYSQITPEDVAGWMLALHLKLVANNVEMVPEANANKEIKTPSVNERMGLKALVRDAKQNAPELAAINDAQAITLLGEVFKQLNLNVKEINEGDLSVPNLGRFQVNEVRREKNGQRKAVKRLIFHSLKNEPKVI